MSKTIFTKTYNLARVAPFLICVKPKTLIGIQSADEAWIYDSIILFKFIILPSLVVPALAAITVKLNQQNKKTTFDNSSISGAILVQDLILNITHSGVSASQDTEQLCSIEKMLTVIAIKSLTQSDFGFVRMCKSELLRFI